MRMTGFTGLVLLLASAAATAQSGQCERGAELTLALEAARAEHGDEHDDVLAIAREIRDLQEALLESNPGRTIEDICNVPAAGADPAAEQRAEAARGGEDPNEVICRRERVTGSHRRRELCMTRAQREQNRRDTQRRMRERRGLDD